MTHFDYLLNAFEQASQADNPAKEGYAEKRRALLAYVRELESYKQDARAENKAAWDSAEYNARRARVAEAAIERMREYAEHDAECQGQPGYDIPCSCGYDELMKELEESK